MFCPACGTQNPDGAKFCAKCGKPVQAETPAPAAKAGSAADQKPASGAPGPQTQFYMAAAGVSTGAKIKRLILFIVLILIVGAAVFFGVRFSMEQQRLKDEAAKQQQNQEAPAPDAVPVAPPAPAAPAPAEASPPASPGAAATSPK